MSKSYPNTPDFWMDFKSKVVSKLGRELRHKEIERVMYHYINDLGVDECVKEFRHKELL